MRPTLLRQPPYRGFYGAIAVIYAATGMFRLELVWILLRATGSAVGVALGLVALELPVLVVGWLGPERLGRGARRIPVLPVYMAASLVAAGLALHASGWTAPVLVALALLQGWWDGLLIPLLQSRLMSFAHAAPRTHRSAGFEVSSRLGMIAGPVLAGLLLASTSPALAVAAAGALMALSAELLAKNPMVHPEAAAPLHPEEAGLRQLAGSVAAVRARPWLSLALMVRGLSNFLWPAFTIGIPLLVLSPWHAGPAGYGVLRALWGIATVGATLVLTAPLILARLQSAYFVSWAVSGIGFLALAASPTYGFAVAATLVGGMGSPLIHVALDSEIGEHIPPAQQGHVFALQRLVMSALTLVGLAVMGPVVASLGAGRVLVDSGLLMVAAAAVGLAWHLRQRLVQPAVP